MKKLLLFLLLIATISASYAQSDSIDHWEVAYYWNSPLKYFGGNEAPPENWNSRDFDDTGWGDFVNIIGYGPLMDEMLGSDAELDLPETTTFYTRTEFNISDSTDVYQFMFAMQFEDAYVVYLNGYELSRKNIGVAGDSPTYDQYADTAHRYSLNLYINSWPEFEAGELFSLKDFKDKLRTGKNVLAIELHNDKEYKHSHHYFTAMFAGIRSENIMFPEFDNNNFIGMWNSFPFPTDLDTSYLPIVDINFPDSTYIPDEPKLMATMKIIDNPMKDYNLLCDTTLDYDGHIGIELRGSSSLMFYPKKPYGIETRTASGENNNVEILGMPTENDWILYSAHGDRAMIRNVLTFKLSRDLGHYAPRTKFVNLVRNGDYRGVYVMMEKIKRDNDRIDIAGLRADELSGDSLTGGYIIKIDKNEDNPEGWYSDFGSAEKENYRTFYQYVYPKPEDIQEEQMAYIQNYMHEFELLLRTDNFDDKENGYRKYINTEAFVDYFIINELSKNMDAYRLSTFLYKDRDDNDGRLHIGPVWDYNLAYGNYQNFRAIETDGWAIDFGLVSQSDPYQLPFWWDRFFQDESFAQQVEDRWTELRQGKLSNVSIMADIDSLTNHISESVEKNAEVWPFIYTDFVWPNMPFADSYDGEVEYMKNWLTDRLDWLDANMGETRDRIIYTSLDSPKAQEYIGIGAYPNPFSNELNFSIELESSHEVLIQIFNINGQSIYTLANENLGSGLHTILWTGESAQGGYAPSGVYFYRIMVDGKLLKTYKIIKQ